MKQTEVCLPCYQAGTGPVYLVNDVCPVCDTVLDVPKVSVEDTDITMEDM